jgi:hypothetical protein
MPQMVPFTSWINKESGHKDRVFADSEKDSYIGKWNHKYGQSVGDKL